VTKDRKIRGEEEGEQGSEEQFAKKRCQKEGSVGREVAGEETLQRCEESGTPKPKRYVTEGLDNCGAAGEERKQER